MNIKARRLEPDSGRPSMHTTTREEDFSVGNPTLDARHRQLILLATRICLRINADASLSQSDIKHLLLDFAELTAHHFSCEERFLAGLNHPQFEHHIRSHSRFTHALASCIARLDTHAVARSELCVLLEDRLIYHILVEDAALKPFIQQMQSPVTTPEPEHAADLEPTSSR